MSDYPPGTVGRFPDGDWSDNLRPNSEAKPPNPVQYRDATLTLPQPEVLIDGVQECLQLQALSRQRGARLTAICVQAKNVHEAAAAVLAAAGLYTDAPSVNLELKALRTFLIREVEPSIYLMKWTFMRARPWTCCGAELNSMFMRPHWLYPGHPSYPSGHATVAWTFAYLFGEFARPRERKLLEATAAQVARNREIAGVHYPSDSEAGRLLARQMVDVMLTKRLSEVDEIETIMRALP
jgi:acid phosphatase (class A)